MNPSELEQRLFQENERAVRPEQPGEKELYRKVLARADEVLMLHTSHMIVGENGSVRRFAVSKKPLQQALWQHLTHFNPNTEVPFLETYLGATYLREDCSDVQIVSVVRTYPKDDANGDPNNTYAIVNEQSEYGITVDGIEDFAQTSIFADSNLVHSDPILQYKSLLSSLNQFDQY